MGFSLSPTAAEFAVIFGQPDSCWPYTSGKKAGSRVPQVRAV